MWIHEHIPVHNGGNLHRIYCPFRSTLSDKRTSCTHSVCALKPLLCFGDIPFDAAPIQPYFSICNSHLRLGWRDHLTTLALCCQVLWALPIGAYRSLRHPFGDFLPWPIRGQNQKEERFDKILKACPPGQDGDNRVLVHLFSNGGSYRFCNLATRYLLTTDTPIPIRALIIDSAPSPCSPRSEADAVTRGLGLTGPIRLLSFAMLLVALSLQWIWTSITWQYKPFSWARKVLNDPAVVDQDSARVYIYSREDQIVDWRGVEAHAEEAQRQGFKVESERFEGSQHVFHAKAEPERYWNVIERTWNSALEAGDVASPEYRKIDQAKKD